MTNMARLACLEDFEVPRKRGRQKARNNVPASTSNEYFKRLIFIPCLDFFWREFSSRFTTLTAQVVLTIDIIPAHVEHLTIKTINSIYDRFGTDLDSTKTSFEQEITVWKTNWTPSKQKPSTIAETFHIYKCFQTS